MKAHEAIAARYVVPNELTVWQLYDPDVHGELNRRNLKFKSGWYAGAGVGSTEVAPEGTSGGWYVKDDRDWGYKIFIGQRLFPHWSGELSFVDTGEAGLGNTNPSIEALIPDATISYKIPTVSGSFHLWGPKNDIDMFARVGLSSIINTVSDSRISYEKQTFAQLNVGVGLQWRFAPNWFVRAEYDSFDNDASFIGVSLARYFPIHDTHRIPKTVEAPVVIQPEAEPIPDPVPEQTCQIFNGAIDAIQFQVDSADLTPQSETALNETAKQLMAYPAIAIEIQAHTDSTASEEYNLDLSNRRADRIKSYLQEQGIAPERLIAKGFGETQPRATNETEAGRSLNRRVEFKIIDSTICE